jgi:hypothetical protein
VVIGDLDLEGVSPGPSKADSPLVVDPDAVLSLSVALQPLQSVPGRYLEIVDALRRVYEQELSVCPPLHIWWQSPRALPSKDLLSLFVGEAANHDANSNAERYYRNSLTARRAAQHGAAADEPQSVPNDLW